MKHNITILVQKPSDQPAVSFVLFISIRNLPLEPAPIDMGREPLGEKWGQKKIPTSSRYVWKCAIPKMVVLMVKNMINHWMVWGYPIFKQPLFSNIYGPGLRPFHGGL